MLEYDEKSGAMTWKIVYYGPALSGKTTNLLSLHDLLADGLPGRMMQLDTKEDRTLFFDLLPLSFRSASGARVKIKVFTVPGQVQYNATRKAGLVRAAAGVFSSALKGAGVRETFEEAVRGAYGFWDGRYGLRERYGFGEDELVGR